MDQKTWLWRKKSSEKTILATNKFDISVKQIDEEVQTIPTEKRPDGKGKYLNEKLASVILDGHAKDDHVIGHAKMEQEAIAGWEKAEAEVISLRKELDEALKQGKVANEKLTSSDAALKECMQRLSLVREEQEQRILDAVLKATSKFDTAQRALEEKLAKASTRLAELAVENSHLSSALLVKEKLIEDHHKHNSQAEAEFSTLIARLDSVEKENAFLKYEFHILEKELEIRNEEMEYSRQSTAEAYKQHLACIKKITKLEAECQRLRLLLRKRLPGPATMVKMKSEVEILGRDQTGMRRRKMNSTTDLVVRDSMMEKCPEFPTSNLNHLIERLRNMEEENKTLKELMTKKNAEHHSSRLISSQTSSRVSHVDISSYDGVSSSGSWATALISELEHFIDGKLKNPPQRKAIEIPEMRLMDDFVEMEKLAIVSVETPGREYCVPTGEKLIQRVPTGEKLIPVSQSHCGLSSTEQNHAKGEADEKSSDWLQVVLQAILKQKCISKQNTEELLEDIRIALGCTGHQGACDVNRALKSSYPSESPPNISGYIAWRCPDSSPTIGSVNGGSSINISREETKKQQVQSNIRKSICKLIELIEGINRTSYNTSGSWSERDQNAEYIVHVFQWKSSELSAVLQQFVCACNHLLDGEVGFENFAGELSSALEWMVNSCATLKEASRARNKIKKHFGVPESGKRNDVGQSSVVETEKIFEEQSQCSLKDQNAISQMESIQFNLHEENNRLKDVLQNVEAKLELETKKKEALAIQLRESEQTIGRLQAELKTLNESKEMIEDQIENEKSINEDLDTQLTVAKSKLNELFQKCSSLEVELEYKSNCCEELEATCLELQLQLESVAKKETPKYIVNQEGKQSQNGWEINAASVKLAECQETILNLGKQLKVLASPRDAALFDKVFSTNAAATNMLNSKRLHKRFSLRDQMLAEDDAKSENLKSPRINQGTSSIKDAKNDVQTPSAALHTPKVHQGSRKAGYNTSAMALAIVPSKKQGIGLLRRLLLRRKKGVGSKVCIPSINKD